MRVTRPCLVSGAIPPLIRIQNGTFYRNHPIGPEDKDQDALFPDLNFTLEATKENNQYWAVVGPSNAGKTTFLEVLSGQHLCFPTKARSYPYLSHKVVLDKGSKFQNPARAIQHVSFSSKQKGLAGLGTYLSARYESRREATDFSVLDFLQGNTELNAIKVEDDNIDGDFLAQVLKDLRLESLAKMPMSNLSNGQSRRARIAKALLRRPELLLLDEPFMGLDPPTTVQMNPLLRNLAESSQPRILLSLRTQDPIPDWITHLVFLGENLRVTHQGPKEEVIDQAFERAAALRGTTSDLDKLDQLPQTLSEFGYILTDMGVAHGHREAQIYSKRTYTGFKKKFDDGDRSDATLKGLGMGQTLGLPNYPYLPMRVNNPTRSEKGEALVEMRGVQVKYGNHIALGGWDSQQLTEVQKDTGEAVMTPMKFENAETEDTSGLWWTVRRGERWVVCGPNGSGKTTLLSLILSDHPQAYSQPVRIFGRSRLPSAGTPGISVFDIQKRIGHSSPEVQAFFPKSLSVRAVLESAYADTPAGRPLMSGNDDLRVSACLRWFRGELNPRVGMDQVLNAEMNRRGRYMPVPYTQLGLTRDKYRQAKEQFWYEFDTQMEQSVAWADDMMFGELTYSAQRVALFLRAIVAQPDIVVLDEAFGGMDEVVRDKCIMFLQHGESKSMTPFERGGQYAVRQRGAGIHKRDANETRNNLAIPEGLTERQALICVSHVASEVPVQVEDWMFLPEAGSDQPCRMGKVTRALRDDKQLWNTIWGMERTPSWSSRAGGYGMYYDFDGSKAAFDRAHAKRMRQKYEEQLKRPMTDDEFEARVLQVRKSRASARHGSGRPFNTGKKQAKEQSGRVERPPGSRLSPYLLLGKRRDEYIPQARQQWRGRRPRRMAAVDADGPAAGDGLDGNSKDEVLAAEAYETKSDEAKTWFDARFTGGQMRRITKRAPRSRRRAADPVMGKEVVPEKPSSTPNGVGPA